MRGFIFNRFMNSSRATNRAWLACLLVMAAFWLTLGTQITFAQEKPAAETDKQDEEEPPPPKLEELKLPPVSQMLKGDAVDWVVLEKEDRVIIAQPVEPRPNTLEIMKKRMKSPGKFEPKELRLDKDGKELNKAEFTHARRVWRQSLPYLSIYLPINTENIYDDLSDHEYLLNIQYVKEIIYFEDLMLKRIDQFLDKKQISEAYELLVALRQRSPKWQGAEQREHQLLFVEAGVYLDKKKTEFALVNLELLHGQAPNYPELAPQLGQVADQLISEADAAGEFRRVRHFLNRLQERLPRHEVVAKWTETLTTRAARLVVEAKTAESGGQIEQALAKAETATRIWPNSEGLRNVYHRLALRHQKLRVGVVLQPVEGATIASETAADSRHRQLTQTLLFEPDAFDGEIVRYRTRFFTQWDPTGLGRRINFQLRQHRQTWESQEVAFAGPLIRRFGEMLNPNHAAFDERFSAGVSAVSLKSPFEFSVQFNSVPLRPEPLFARASNIPGTFSRTNRDVGKISYHRAIAEPTDEKQFHVAEVVEVKYPSWERAMQGLLRGEVSFLPHVPLADVDRLTENKKFAVHKYQLPTTHVIQFNPRNQALRNRPLRRALAYALNRQKMLEQLVLKTPANDKARLTSAPFSRKSYAFASGVPLYKYDISLAAAMVIAARKELGKTLPPLRLLCPAEPFSRSIANQLIAAWSQIGLEVTLVPTTGKPANDQDWDLVYRTVSMHEPAIELWPFLTLQSTAQVASLQHLPNWLRQELVELDRAANFGRARELLHRLHRHLAAETHLIPLWETDDYLAVRQTIRGVPAEPIITYDGITQWTVQPWYSRQQP